MADEVGPNAEVHARIDRRTPGGRITIGAGSLVDGYLVTETAQSEIRIGRNVFIGGGGIMDCVASIVLEDDVLVSYHCFLMDSNNHSLRYSVRKEDLQLWRSGRYDFGRAVSAPIRICRGAWLGARAMVLKGVTVGEGAVIGAGSVVTRDVPAWTVTAGNPARVIRTIPENER